MIFDDDMLGEIDQRLADTDSLLEHSYPGDDGRRQAVHTVYVPADQFTPGTPKQWGQQALSSVHAQGSLDQLAQLVIDQSGVHEGYTQQLAQLVEDKLHREPIEDLRLDFEDGYGRRSDAEEDEHAVRAAKYVAQSIQDQTAPPFIGVRFKSLESDVRVRGLRTLELYLSTLIEHCGELPDSTVLTLPKVTTVDQIKAMNDAASALESGLGLPAESIRYEVQVETPQLIVNHIGSAEIAPVLHAGQGRITSLHYGTYDYSASLGIAAAFQAMDHPAADFAKNVILTAVAGTGVHFSDGSTNILPVGTDEDVRAAWQLHARLVGRHLRRGIYQGWDLHPAQLPTRFLATFDFFNRSLESAIQRLEGYVRAETGGVMDEPATAKALARYILRSTACGAADLAETLPRIGVDQPALSRLASSGLVQEPAV